MKEILAVIRMNMMHATKQALVDAGFSAFTARKVFGRGVGNVDYQLLQGAVEGHEEAISRLAPGPRLVPKRLISLVAQDKHAAAIVKTIIDVNQTGKPGDGKVFVLPVSEATRIRTGERDEAAIDETID